MTALQWDLAGEHRYETGVDHGVLYPSNEFGEYDTGFAWNGLVNFTESPTGGEANPQYADNIKYLNLYSVEEFGATLEAFTYPPQFEQFDGMSSPFPGVVVGQQRRGTFGLVYRTKVGTDLNDDAGYKLHLNYGLTASPSEKQHTTVNDSPEAMTFSWDIMSLPVPVTGLKPTSTITVDSTIVDPDALADLEDILFGTIGADPRLPLPDEVIALFDGSVTEVQTLNPTFVSSTGVITIPTVTGVVYRRADTNAVVSGTVTIGVAGAFLTIRARATDGYVLSDTSDDSWTFQRDL